MSKIRTLADLNERISAEFAWRKKELHHLKDFVLSAKSGGGGHLAEMAVRCAVTLLYAHWEGFVKSIGTSYVEFVSRQKLRHDQLVNGFLALVLRRALHDAGASSKTEAHLKVIDFFRNRMPERCSLLFRNCISTKANLKSELFRDIVLMLGLDYAPYAPKEKLLDEKLLRNRNEIAHGKHLVVDLDEYLDLHEEMLAIMQTFYNQVDNASFTRAYAINAAPSV